MKVEGIVIQKTPFKERDLICHLLLRTGKTLPVYFYGGRGGGKKGKGSIIEIGFMLKVELQNHKKKLETNIHIAKEYSLIWASDLIRNNYQALCLQSFYLEIIAKLTVGEDINEIRVDEHAGLFNVLSNALFFLDKALGGNCFNQSSQQFLFFSKLINQLGVTPDMNHCLYCSKEFKEREMCLFLPHEGGFSCHECQTQKDEFLSDNKQLLEEFQTSTTYREVLKHSFVLAFKDFQKLEKISNSLINMSFNYINYQFEFKKDQFKTWKML